jgi:hypothetical protein
MAPPRLHRPVAAPAAPRSAAPAAAPRRAALAAALLLATAARAEGPRSDRPLGVITAGPLRALLLDPALVDVRAGAEPSVEVRWWAANSWSIPTTLARGGEVAQVQLDAQTDVLSVTGHVAWGDRFPGSGLAARLDTAVEARLVHHWGGWTDGPIEAWHRLGRYNDFERPDYPQDAVRLRLAGGPRPVASLDGPATGLGDLTVRTWLRLAEGEGGGGAGGDGEPTCERRPWAVALRLALKAPTGRPSELTGSGGADAALGLAASGSPLGWLTAHAMATVGLVSPLPAASALQPRRWPLAAEVSLVARLGPDWSLLLEDRLQSAWAERGWRLSGAEPTQGDAVMAVTRAQNRISGGVRWRGVTFWFTEDFMLGSRAGIGKLWFYDDNAPDFVIGLAVAR